MVFASTSTGSKILTQVPIVPSQLGTQASEDNLLSEILIIHFSLL